MEPIGARSRQTDMKLRILAVVPLVLLATACGRNAQVNAPAPSAPGCPTAVTITTDDNNKTVCVAIGGTVTVDLRTPGVTNNSPIDSTGAALTTSTKTAPQASLAVFDATTAGSSVISSMRPNCPSAAPGTLSCHSIMAWKVTIQVK